MEIRTFFLSLRPHSSGVPAGWRYCSLAQVVLCNIVLCVYFYFVCLELHTLRGNLRFFFLHLIPNFVWRQSVARMAAVRILIDADSRVLWTVRKYCTGYIFLKLFRR